MFSPEDPIKNLVDHFSKLPGIGERTALRLVLHLIGQKKEELIGLSEALLNVADKIKECDVCAMLTAEKEFCRICLSPVRDKSLLCVVSSIQDLMAIESTGEYRGQFHVLHGVLAPMEGIGPKDLRIKGLKERLQADANFIREIIVATPPTIEGEATGLFLSEELKNIKGLSVSRIASGVPVGGDLHFADKLTLSRSIALRREFI